MVMYKLSVNEALDKPSKARSIFEENGFVHITNVYSDTSCEDAIEEIKEIEKNLSESNSAQLVTETIDKSTVVKYFQGIYTQSPVFRRFFSFRLMSIASTLLRSNDIYFADMEAHIRNPGGSEIPRHQDNFYFNLVKAKGLTAYIALSNHCKDSGGLNYKIGSHKRVVNHRLSEVKGFSSYIPADSDDYAELQGDIYAPKYKIGDVTIHHPNNIHWSEANPAGKSRGYAISARVFDLNEKIDPAGVERYKRLLSANRA